MASRPVELNQITTEMLEAIELELKTIRKELGVLGDLYSVEVKGGRQLVAEPGAYLYRFHCSLRIEQRIPVDTRVQLITPAESVSGALGAERQLDVLPRSERDREGACAARVGAAQDEEFRQAMDATELYIF